MNLLKKNRTAVLITLITLVLMFSLISPTFFAVGKKPVKPTTPPNGYDWDKSSIEITGECHDDPDLEAVFYITNTGESGGGDMDGPTLYYIYINDVLQGDPVPFQLDGKETIKITVDAGCDDTITLKADQRPGHKGNSHPQFTIIFEDCECSEID